MDRPSTYVVCPLCRHEHHVERIAELESKLVAKEAEVEALRDAADMLEKHVASLTTDMEEMESMLFVAYNKSGSGKSYFNWEHNLKESCDERS